MSRFATAALKSSAEEQFFSAARTLNDYRDDVALDFSDLDGGSGRDDAGRQWTRLLAALALFVLLFIGAACFIRGNMDRRAAAESCAQPFALAGAGWTDAEDCPN